MRSELRNFAKAQEEILKDNDEKTHWSHSSDEYLLERITEELQELKKAKVSLDKQKECIDVANFCMMLFDNIENSCRERSKFLKAKGYKT